MARSRGARTVLGLCAIALCASGLAGATPPPIDWDALGDEAVALLRHYVRIRTVNPPGNETLAADYLRRTVHRGGDRARALRECARARQYRRPIVGERHAWRRLWCC